MGTPWRMFFPPDHRPPRFSWALAEVGSGEIGVRVQVYGTCLGIMQIGVAEALHHRRLRRTDPRTTTEAHQHSGRRRPAWRRGQSTSRRSSRLRSISTAAQVDALRRFTLILHRVLPLRSRTPATSAGSVLKHQGEAHEADSAQSRQLQGTGHVAGRAPHRTAPTSYAVRTIVLGGAGLDRQAHIRLCMLTVAGHLRAARTVAMSTNRPDPDAAGGAASGCAVLYKGRFVPGLQSPRPRRPPLPVDPPCLAVHAHRTSRFTTRDARARGRRPSARSLMHHAPRYAAVAAQPSRVGSGSGAQGPCCRWHAVTARSPTVAYGIGIAAIATATTTAAQAR